MSAYPIFGGLKKITFKSTRERQEFIEDLVYLGIAKSLLETSLNNEVQLDKRVITYHKNRYRKEKKKIQNCTNYIVEESWKIYDRLENNDILTLQHKIKQCAKSFIEVISQEVKKSLELVAIALLDYGFNRKRKTPLREELKLFTDYKLLYGKLGKAIEDAKVREMDVEVDIAKLLIERIDYKKLK